MVEPEIKFKYEHDINGMFLTKEELAEAAGESGILTGLEIMELFNKKYGYDLMPKSVAGYIDVSEDISKSVCKVCRHIITYGTINISNCPYCGAKFKKE